VESKPVLAGGHLFLQVLGIARQQAHPQCILGWSALGRQLEFGDSGFHFGTAFGESCFALHSGFFLYVPEFMFQSLHFPAEAQTITG
jgi:hypothetical protein